MDVALSSRAPVTKLRRPCQRNHVCASPSNRLNPRTLAQFMEKFAPTPASGGQHDPRSRISKAALRHKLPVTILAQGCRDWPTSIVQLKSQCRTVRDQASETPHQFRTRNNLIRTQRTRSKSNKNAAKSTKLIDILPLITVWLLVHRGRSLLRLPGCSSSKPLTAAAQLKS